MSSQVSLERVEPMWTRAIALSVSFMLAMPWSPLQAQDEQLAKPQTASADPNWQRYERNQSFNGGVYFRDNNIWVYDKHFSDLFGMPARYIEGIDGAVAAAFRIEDSSFLNCGWGGRAEVCTKVEYCYLDLYFDETRTPLPWATDMRQAWVPMYASHNWLRALSRKEKPRGMRAYETPPGIVRALEGSPLIAFADPKTKLEAFFTSNIGDPSAGPEEVSGGFLAVLGYARNFYRDLSLVSLQMSCSPFSRRSINVRLDSKSDIYATPIARFNRIKLPEAFVQRMKEVIDTRRQRNTDFNRSLFPPPLGTRGAAPSASQSNQ